MTWVVIYVRNTNMMLNSQIFSKSQLDSNWSDWMGTLLGEKMGKRLSWFSAVCLQFIWFQYWQQCYRKKGLSAIRDESREKNVSCFQNISFTGISEPGSECSYQGKLSAVAFQAANQPIHHPLALGPSSRLVSNRVSHPKMFPWKVARGEMSRSVWLQLHALATNSVRGMRMRLPPVLPLVAR